jgi:L-ribulokinase
MSRNRYTIGVDFGTESARAVLVDVADGRELATAVHQYATGVIDERLPHLDEDVVLEHDWALQDPANYIASFQVAVPRALAESGVDPADVIVIGIDFTVCTMLPTTADGTPLRFLADHRRQTRSGVSRVRRLRLEPQRFPDAVNQRAFSAVVLRPSARYRQTIIYHFSPAA